MHTKFDTPVVNIQSKISMHIHTCQSDAILGSFVTLHSSSSDWSRLRFQTPKFKLYRLYLQMLILQDILYWTNPFTCGRISKSKGFNPIKVYCSKKLDYFYVVVITLIMSHVMLVLLNAFHATRSIRSHAPPLWMDKTHVKKIFSTLQL